MQAKTKKVVGWAMVATSMLAVLGLLVAEHGVVQTLLAVAGSLTIGGLLLVGLVLALD